MSTLTTILLGAATRVGAPIVKSILQEHVGGAVGEIGGTIIDVIAGKAGVAPEDLPNLPAGDIDAAVKATEAEAPELVLAWARQQELANQLQLAEMAKEPLWAWAWRPAWMWFLAVIWAWRLVVVPIVDASVGSTMASAIELTTLAWLTSLYCGLYMGGHTIKEGLSTWRAKP